MKIITITERQEWFIKCAIEAKDAVLPLNEKSLDNDQFEKDYFFTKSEIEEEINKLKLNIDKAVTTMGHTVYPEMTKSEYYLRCSWDATCQERDELKDQIKVLSAIKKGLESSLKECVNNKENTINECAELADSMIIIPTGARSKLANAILNLKNKNKETLSSLEKYPEFKTTVSTIVANTITSINYKSKKVESEMPYKRQFILEEVIKELQTLV